MKTFLCVIALCLLVCGCASQPPQAPASPSALDVLAKIRGFAREQIGEGCAVDGIWRIGVLYGRIKQEVITVDAFIATPLWEGEPTSARVPVEGRQLNVAGQLDRRDEGVCFVGKLGFQWTNASGKPDAAFAVADMQTARDALWAELGVSMRADAQTQTVEWVAFFLFKGPVEAAQTPPDSP